MWPRWSRLSSHGGSTTATAAASAGSNPPAIKTSFSFNDLRSLVDDEQTYAAKESTTAAVFHRVRIASSTLRAWKSLAAAPPPPPESNKIVVYYTSLRVVRKTFEDCRAVRSILRGFHVAVDERDLSMDLGFLAELKQILGKKELALPRVFIGGRYVGGFDEIQHLHESGELKRMVEGLPAQKAGNCEVCGGNRFVLCGVCNGSHKFYSEKKNGFRSCNACNENGIVRCPDCCE